MFANEQLSDASMPAPEHLRVEGLLESVAVISEPLPRFSFLHGELASGGSFGVTQTSYHIKVTETDATAADVIVWDSGDVQTSNCSQIVFAGRALTPFTRYTWSVSWTASTGAKSATATARFETGPLSVGDWQGAGWLNGTKRGGAGKILSTKSQLRNEFEVPAGQTIVFARVYVAAMGCAHIEVNGRVPMPDLRGICPWPVYSDSARYMTHDVTRLLVTGRNALGVIAGWQSGRWRNEPQVILLVVIKLASKRSPIFLLSSSSAGWMGREPYVAPSTAWDATVDWTKREEGWSTAGFTPGPGWSVVTAGSTSTPGLAVSAHALAMPLSAEVGRVKPVSVLETRDGSFLYTFPKNFVGTIEFAPLPSAEQGSNLTVLLGEWLAPAPAPPPTPPPAPKSARCGLVAENQVLHLGCTGGKTIDDIVFASWGTPVLANKSTGCATGFKEGICSKTGKIGNSKNSLPIVRKLCLNKKSCAVLASRRVFDDPPPGPPHDPCGGVVKALAAEVHCSGDPPGASCTGSCYDLPPGTTTTTPPKQPDPTFPKISGSVQQYENHILRAGNKEPLSTLFCWHGFQYVRVTPNGHTGFTGALDAIVALETHTNMTATGSLTFSGEGYSYAENAAEVLTHINEMTLQSQRSNVGAYMPTDCPTREKHGWLGDALDASEQALYNFDVGPIHEAFFRTIEDSQDPVTGDILPVVPKPGKFGSGCNDIAWTSAYPQIISMQHRYLGNTRTLRRRWTSLVRYQENLIANAEINGTANPHEGLAVCDQFKDWLCGNAQSCCAVRGAQDCPVGAEMGGFSYVLGLRAMSQMATVLGNSSAAARYASLAHTGTQAFHSFFYNRTVGRYGGDANAVLSLSLPALKIGSPPTALHPHVVETVGCCYE